MKNALGVFIILAFLLGSCSVMAGDFSHWPASVIAVGLIVTMKIVNDRVQILRWPMEFLLALRGHHDRRQSRASLHNRPGLLMMDEKPALKISGLTRSFGRRLAVDSVDLAVARGEILGFLGPNGAGKTTLMNLVMGLLVPDGGEIELLGVKGGARTREVKAEGRLPPRRNHAYIPRCQHGAISTCFCQALRRYRPGEAGRRGARACWLVAGGRHASCHLFRVALQQRVCLARVMLHRPEFPSARRTHARPRSDGRRGDARDPARNAG